MNLKFGLSLATLLTFVNQGDPSLHVYVRFIGTIISCLVDYGCMEFLQKILHFVLIEGALT